VFNANCGQPGLLHDRRSQKVFGLRMIAMSEKAGTRARTKMIDDDDIVISGDWEPEPIRVSS